MNRLAFSALISLTLLGCNTTTGPKPQENAQPAKTVGSSESQGTPKAKPQSASIEGKITETIDVANYTYLNVETATGKVWTAVPKTPVSVGEQVVIEQPMLMKKFHSPTLNRDFDEIYFGVLRGAKPAIVNPHAGVSGSAPLPLPVPSTIAVAKASGADAYSVAEVVKQASKLKGKTVTIQAMVVKVNNGIMEKNWVHIQDGSGNPQDKTNDLILTTQETAQVGTTVLIRGKVATDRDFGAGYSYQVMLEDVTITPSKAKP